MVGSDRQRSGGTGTAAIPDQLMNATMMSVPDQDPLHTAIDVKPQQQGRTHLG